MSVYEFQKLLTVAPVARSGCDPASSVNASVTTSQHDDETDLLGADQLSSESAHGAKLRREWPNCHVDVMSERHGRIEAEDGRPERVARGSLSIKASCVARAILHSLVARMTPVVADAESRIRLVQRMRAGSGCMSGARVSVACAAAARSGNAPDPHRGEQRRAIRRPFLAIHRAHRQAETSASAAARTRSSRRRP